MIRFFIILFLIAAGLSVLAGDRLPIQFLFALWQFPAFLVLIAAIWRPLTQRQINRRAWAFGMFLGMGGFEVARRIHILPLPFDLDRLTLWQAGLAGLGVAILGRILAHFIRKGFWALVGGRDDRHPPRAD